MPVKRFIDYRIHTLEVFNCCGRTMSGVCQQILALDARYNAHRTPNNPQFRNLYIRRRSQLLRENALEQAKSEGTSRKDYLNTRVLLLSQKYGCLSDQESIRSRSLSAARSNNKYALESLDQCEPNAEFRYQEGMVVPAIAADASRAIVGGTTLDENYAFGGVHHIFDQHTDAVTSVQFANNDKQKLACSSLDNNLSICSLDPPSVLFILKGHSKSVPCFQWSTNDDMLVSCSLDCTIRLWDTQKGSCIRILSDTSADSSPITAVAFHHLNNNIVLFGNGKGMVKSMNISTGIIPKSSSVKVCSSGAVRSLAFDSSGLLIWVGDDKGVITSVSFDLAAGKLNKERRMVIGECNPITCLSVRTWISREARDPSLLVNCANNSLFLFRITDNNGGLSLKRRFPIKHKFYPLRSSFCPLMSFRQGACIATGNEDGCVYLLDVERDVNRTPIVNKLQGHNVPVLDACFNYDESLLASCDAQGMVIIWKRETKLEKDRIADITRLHNSKT